jgi:hypothetical protein
MEIMMHDVLRWMHVIFAAYWLGGEWGVFNASTNVANADLTIDDRLRHMETAYRIDILPRSAIIWLLPVGFQMGDTYGLSPISGIGIPIIWVLTAIWWCIIFASFKHRGTALGIKITEFDDKIRYIVIPGLWFLGGYTLLTDKVFNTGEEVFGTYWFAIKLVMFGFILIIGLALRIIMKGWAVAFRRLREEGSTPEIEAMFTNTLATGRKCAYIYWVSIITMAFIGVTKPF